MSNRYQRERDGMVRLDVEKLERARIRKGYSKEKLATEADLHRGTIIRACRGRGVFVETALAIANVLNVDAEELRSQTEQVPPTSSCGLPSTDEWSCDEAMSAWIQAANGLQFRICRMRHRFDESRQARGKFYDLLVEESSWQELERGLELARRVIRAKRERRTDPGPAQDSNPCIDCELGRPQDYRKGKTELVINDITLAAFVTDDINNCPCVSDCGTRYRWIPTHRDAIARRLTD